MEEKLNMDKEEKSICNNILSMIKGRLRTMCDLINYHLQNWENFIMSCL